MHIINSCRIQLLVLILLMIACKKEKKEFEGQLYTFIESQQSGIDFNNTIKETPTEHLYTFNYIYNGAGVAIADFDNDGWEDIYFTGNQVSDRIYKNLKNFKFEDVSKTSGILNYKGWHNGVSTVDINCDGLMDLYICRGGFHNTPENKNLLLINKGSFVFEDQAERYGIADNGYSITSTFFDYDNDGDLDLYVDNRPEKWGIYEDEIVGKKKSMLSGSLNDPLVSDKLFRNNGDLTFTDVSYEAGFIPNYGYGLGAVAGDLNKDGYQDLYIANDFTENDYLYINYGNGTFKEMIKALTNHVPFYSMGVDFGDINNDGFEEILNVEMRPDDYKRSKTTMPAMQPEFFAKLKALGFQDQYMHNALQYNFGNGFFTDISQLAGVDKTDWSWAALINDLDNDGFKDIYITNGYRRDVYDRDTNKEIADYLKKNNNVVKSTEEVLGKLPSVKLANYIYKNQKDLTFKKMIKTWGVDQPSFSNGAAFGDLDNDGDLDLVVNNVDDPAFLYQNNINQTQNYLRVKCIGDPKNTFGLGAKVSIFYGDQQQYVQIKTSRGYLSSSEPIAHFGLGNIQKIDRLLVEWPDYTTVEEFNIPVNRLMEIVYQSGQKLATEVPQYIPVFAESTGEFIFPNFIHRENLFDDYQKQVLLPHSLSKLGPFISVADVDGDDREDFYIGGAHGQPGQLYTQNASGHFIAKVVPIFEKDKDYEDMQSIFFDADGDKDLDLYVVSGGTEFVEGHPIYQDRLYLNDGHSNFTKDISRLPLISSSGSCVVSCDFDGDGDIDLFRGGRTIPDKYPYPPRSYILENTGSGRFKDVTEDKAVELKEIGMVSSAVWEDVNGDNLKDLVIVGEWMPVTIFENQKNKLIKADPKKYGLEQTTGWWNKIISTDFDNDGDIDFVLGNLGLNYKFHASPEKPFMVYCDDYDNSGTYDIVLAKYNGEDIVPVRGKQCSSEQVPDIEKKFANYSSFSEANVKQIYGEGLDNGLKYEATMFQSVILKNDGGKFQIIFLPNLAQFSTIQAIVSEDFNLDGYKDLMIGGNLFNAEIETTRADASVGLLFLGDRNNLVSRALGPQESGFFIPFDVKDLKAIKVNNKPCILVGINNNAALFFKNLK